MHAFLVPTCFALLFLRSALAAPDTELDRVRGTWWLVLTADDKRTDDGSESVTMNISPSGRVQLKTGGLITNEGTLHVRSAKDGQLLDLSLSTGAILARYEFRDGDLVLCCDWKQNGRPTAMTPQGGQWLERWRRTTY